MEYGSPAELKDAFMSGHVEALPDDISVNGVEYQKSKANDVPFEDLIEGHKIGMFVYTVKPTKANKERLKKVGAKNVDEPGLHEWIVFAWKAHDLHVYPLGVTSTTQARASAMGRQLPESETYEQNDEIKEAVTPAQQSAAQKKEQEWKARVIGKTAQISFPQFGRAKSVTGKVDTGANISSLHAENIKISDGVVTCKIPALSDNTLRMKVQTQQAVKSADGGTEYRPVILLDVNINGQAVHGAEFNLNDRSKMNHDVLIGHNVLEKAKLIIDPTMEGIDWNHLATLFENVDGSTTSRNPLKGRFTVAEAYELILNNNISFDELFVQARTAGVEAAGSVEA